MDPTATTAAATSASMTRRRSLAGKDALADEWELGRRRVAELEATVARLWAEKEAAVSKVWAEKEAAERAAEALRAELEMEKGFAETAASEAVLMIARLQQEKSAAMMEAREFRRVAELRAARERELQEQLAEVYEIATSYQALLQAHGINPDDAGAVKDESDESNQQDERPVERVVENDIGESSGHGVVIEEPLQPSPPPPLPLATEEFQDKHPVDVRCAATTKAVEEELVIAGVAGDLCARVEALEADSVAVRREVAALRSERAQVVLARRVCRDAAEKKQGFSVLNIFKWFFSRILWGTKRSASAARKLPNVSSSPIACFLLGLLPLLQRSKGTLRIQSKTSCQPAHSHGLQYLMICYFFQ